MIIGRPEHFTKAHFEGKAGVAPPPLCELVVHCLELVAQLARRGLQFRFKGGNSLLVLLEDPQRFSIDVDIVTTVSKEALIELVGAIVADGPLFTRFEHRAPRTKPWLPMISFKLFFESKFPADAEPANVMLDCVLEPPPYGGVERRVKCLDLYDCDQTVEVPSISGLIGDKLLTIGPSTLGIPLGKNKEAQRLKHVFDVALLSRQPHDLAEIRASIVGCMAQENRIQGRVYTYEEVARDTLRFCDEALAFAEKPALEVVDPASYAYEIVKGFDGFRAHLFKLEYTWAMLRDDCARVRGFFDEVGSP